MVSKIALRFVDEAVMRRYHQLSPVVTSCHQLSLVNPFLYDMMALPVSSQCIIISDVVLQASSSYRSGGLHVTLANRFISETSKADDNPPTAVNGLVSAAGLKLRTSAPTGATDSPPRVTISTAKNTASEAKRSTFDWRPTSLLCKRLNVPAPDGSSTQGLTSKGKRQSGGQASGGELIDSEPFQRFTSESSISTMSNRPKVRVLWQCIINSSSFEGPTRQDFWPFDVSTA